MGNFKFLKTDIPGIVLIEPKVFGDDRGFFMESYQQKVFAEGGIEGDFVQDNHSKSSKGVLRGLHYQIPPSPMAKLVRCLRGRVFDVGVDIRKGSPTFGKWHGEILSAENKKMLYLPAGCAHGFLALADGAEVYYKCTNFYDPKNERAIIWNDPEIGIMWPLAEVGGEPILSDRDKVHPQLKVADIYAA